MPLHMCNISKWNDAADCVKLSSVLGKLEIDFPTGKFLGEVLEHSTRPFSLQKAACFVQQHESAVGE